MNTLHILCNIIFLKYYELESTYYNITFSYFHIICFFFQTRETNFSEQNCIIQE